VNILSDLTSLVTGLGIPVETGVFSDVAPDEYVVITPLSDSFPLFSDNFPGYDLQEARLSIYSKGNYLELKSKVTEALLIAGFSITDRRYIGHEDDTGYHHYAIDAANVFMMKG